MQSVVWKDLLCELHAHILQFCSMRQLSRLRSVCRTWNDLKHKLGFAFKFQSQHTFIFKAPPIVHIYSIIHRETKNTMDAISQIREEEDCNDEIMDLLRSDLFDTTTQNSDSICMEFLYDGIKSRYALLDRFQIMATYKVCVGVMVEVSGACASSQSCCEIGGQDSTWSYTKYFLWICRRDDDCCR